MLFFFFSVQNVLFDVLPFKLHMHILDASYMSLFVLLLARVFFCWQDERFFQFRIYSSQYKIIFKSVLRLKYYLHGVASKLVPWLWKFAIFTLVITKMSICPVYYDFGIVIIVMGINFRFWKWGDRFRSDPKLRGCQVHISLFYNCVTVTRKFFHSSYVSYTLF